MVGICGHVLVSGGVSGSWAVTCHPCSVCTLCDGPVPRRTPGPSALRIPQRPLPPARPRATVGTGRPLGPSSRVGAACSPGDRRASACSSLPSGPQASLLRDHGSDTCPHLQLTPTQALPGSSRAPASAGSRGGFWVSGGRASQRRLPSKLLVLPTPVVQRLRGHRGGAHGLGVFRRAVLRSVRAGPRVPGGPSEWGKVTLCARMP